MEYRRVRRARSASVKQEWDAEQLRALRRYLGMSQRELAEEMGVRQQTVSEWETSVYRPRGASVRLLSMIAERASFDYAASPVGEEDAVAGVDRAGVAGSTPAGRGQP